MAQLSRTIYKTTVLQDTLAAVSNKDFLYNNITVTNLTTDKISVLVTITPPQGWQLITQNILTVSLNANENSIIPIRLLPAGSNTASWSRVKIEYRLNNGVETTTDTFRVRVQEFMKFKGNLPNSNLVLTAYQKTITFPVFVKNMGNTPNTYTVGYQNNFLKIEGKNTVTLQPGRDTVLQVTMRLTEDEWAMLRKEDIKVYVAAQNGETINLFQNISKVGYMLKEHSSAFLDMPLQLETGVMYQGVDDIQYYGALHGSVNFSDQERLAIDLRSNTYSKGQVLDNHMIRADYTSKHWHVSAGNVMELTDFIMDGYGGKLGYHWLEKSKAEIYGMLKSRSGDSKLAGGNLVYQVTESIRGSNNATANFDDERKLYSYIVKQGADFKIGEKAKLQVNGAAGMEQSMNKLVGNASNTIIGSSLGYNFQWATNYFSAFSNVLYNSNSYPGIFKGQRLQIHDVRGMYKKVFLGAYYEYNFRQQNFYTDTALFSNVFNLKTENFGARTGVNLKTSNITLSAGRQRQLQPSDSTNFNYIYNYLNLTTNFTLFEGLYFTTNSYAGTGQIIESTNNTTFVSSNQGTAQYKFIGMSVRYDKGPYYYHEYVNYLKTPQEYERLIVSPYLDFSLFKNSLNFRTQFNYASSKPDGSINSNLLANLVYSSNAYGFDFNISGIIPIQQAQPSPPFISASLRVRLHAPFVLARKYYQLKLVLYKDVNSNGVKDAGEEPISGQTLAINDNLFVSDAGGHAIFRNVSKGDYKLDFGLSSKVRGWIPKDGVIQHMALNGNITAYIPYKVSKVLQGKVTLNADANSTLNFSLGNIKVTAVSSDTVSYSTLTNEEGEFYFNLPADNYIVTLSPEAFDDNFRPTQFSQNSDLINNNTTNVYFEIKQKKRQINIKKKE